MSALAPVDIHAPIVYSVYVALSHAAVAGSQPMRGIFPPMVGAATTNHRRDSYWEGS